MENKESTVQVAELRGHHNAEQARTVELYPPGRSGPQVALRESAGKVAGQQQQQQSDVVSAGQHQDEASPPSSETAASSGASESAGEEECLDSAVDVQVEGEHCRDAEVSTTLVEGLTNEQNPLQAQTHSYNSSLADEGEVAEAGVWETAHRKIVVRRVSSADSTTTTASEDGAGRWIGLPSPCSSPGKCLLRAPSIAEDVFVPVELPDEAVSSKCYSPQSSSSSTVCCSATSPLAFVSQKEVDVQDAYTRLGGGLSYKEAEKSGDSFHLQRGGVGNLSEKGGKENDVGAFLGSGSSGCLSLLSGGAAAEREGSTSLEHGGGLVPVGQGGCWQSWGGLPCGRANDVSGGGGLQGVEKADQHEGVDERRKTRRFGRPPSEPGTYCDGLEKNAVCGPKLCCERKTGCSGHQTESVCCCCRSFLSSWGPRVCADSQRRDLEPEDVRATCRNCAIPCYVCPTICTTSAQNLPHRTSGKADDVACTCQQGRVPGGRVGSSCTLPGGSICGEPESHVAETLQYQRGLPGAAGAQGGRDIDKLPLLGPQEAAKTAVALAEACAETFAVLGWLTKSETNGKGECTEEDTADFGQATAGGGDRGVASEGHLRQYEGEEERERDRKSRPRLVEEESRAVRINKRPSNVASYVHATRCAERAEAAGVGPQRGAQKVTAADCVIQDVEDLRRASKRQNKEARKRRRRLQKLLESPFGLEEMEQILRARKGELQFADAVTGAWKALSSSEDCGGTMKGTSGAQPSGGKLSYPGDCGPNDGRLLAEAVPGNSSVRCPSVSEKEGAETTVASFVRRQAAAGKMPPVGLCQAAVPAEKESDRQTSETLQQLVYAATQFEALIAPMHAARTANLGKQTAEPGDTVSSPGGRVLEEQEQPGADFDMACTEGDGTPGGGNSASPVRETADTELEGCVSLPGGSQGKDEGGSPFSAGDSGLSRFSSFSTSCSYPCRRLSHSSTRQFSRAASTASLSFDLSPCTARGAWLASAGEGGDKTVQEFGLDEDEAQQRHGFARNSEPDCRKGFGEGPKEGAISEFQDPADRASSATASASCGGPVAGSGSAAAKRRWPERGAVSGASTTCARARLGQGCSPTAVRDDDLRTRRDEEGDDDKDSCCSEKTASTAACIELMLEMLCAAGDDEAFAILDASERSSSAVAGPTPEEQILSWGATDGRTADRGGNLAG